MLPPTLPALSPLVLRPSLVSLGEALATTFSRVDATRAALVAAAPVSAFAAATSGLSVATAISGARR